MSTYALNEYFFCNCIILEICEQEISFILNFTKNAKSRHNRIRINLKYQKRGHTEGHFSRTYESRTVLSKGGQLVALYLKSSRQ